MKLSHRVFIPSSLFTLSTQANQHAESTGPVYKQLPQNTRKVLQENSRCANKKNHPTHVFIPLVIQSLKNHNYGHYDTPNRQPKHFKYHQRRRYVNIRIQGN